MAQRVKVSPDLIGGDVDEGYGKVADVFRRNMVSGQRSGRLSRSTAMASKSSISGVVSAMGSPKRRGRKTPSSTCSRLRKVLPRSRSQSPRSGTHLV